MPVVFRSNFELEGLDQPTQNFLRFELQSFHHGKMVEPIAENLFKEFTAEGTAPGERQQKAAARIRALLSDSPRPVESQWLEFKSGFTKEEDFAHTWSKTIGAFANAGGGVVIYGVYASRQKGDNADVVRDIQPIPDVEKFLTKLKQASHINTDPPLSGISYYSIIEDASSKSGFIVALIPEGTQKPYESLKSKDRFYYRFDDETKKASLPLLRMLFSPNYHCRAEISVSVSDLDSDGRYAFDCSVINKGFISIEEGIIIVTAGGYPIQKFDHPEMRRAYQFALRPTIHPSMQESIEFVLTRKRQREMFQLCFTLYLKNHAPLQARQTFSCEDGSFVSPPDAGYYTCIPFTAAKN